jgi:hypothetical protein
MSLQPPTERSNSANDPVWDLLSRDAVQHPVTPSPWFADRTAARAVPRKAPLGHLIPVSLRWMLPFPAAALAMLAMLAIHGSHSIGKSNMYVSSNAEFEQHMEFLCSSSE